MRFIVPVIGWWWFCPMAFCLMLLGIEAVTSMLRRQFIPLVYAWSARCFGESGDLLVAILSRAPNTAIFFLSY